VQEPTRYFVKNVTECDPKSYQEAMISKHVACRDDR
jgi:hypothetical protein